MDELKAGRELDALIAERFFDFKWEGNPRGNRKLVRPDGVVAVWKNRGAYAAYTGYPDGANLPRYSTDIAAAWEVVSELKERKYYVCIEHVHTPHNRWNAWVGDKNVYAESAPLAICLAALKAVAFSLAGERPK